MRLLTKLVGPAVSQGSDGVCNHMLEGKREAGQWEGYCDDPSSMFVGIDGYSTLGCNLELDLERV